MWDADNEVIVIDHRGATLQNSFLISHENLTTMDVQGNSKLSNNKNPHIKDMKEDVLYHLGLSTGAQDLKAMFGDVKVISYYKLLLGL